MQSKHAFFRSPDMTQNRPDLRFPPVGHAASVVLSALWSVGHFPVVAWSLVDMACGQVKSLSRGAEPNMVWMTFEPTWYASRSSGAGISYVSSVCIGDKVWKIAGDHVTHIIYTQTSTTMSCDTYTQTSTTTSCSRRHRAQESEYRE